MLFLGWGNFWFFSCLLSLHYYCFCCGICFYLPLCCLFQKSFFFKVFILQTWEMIQWLRVHTAEEQNFLPSTHRGQLISACNSRFKRSGALFWPLWAVHSHAHAYACIHIFLMFLILGVHYFSGGLFCFYHSILYLTNVFSYVCGNIVWFW